MHRPATAHSAFTAHFYNLSNVDSSEISISEWAYCGFVFTRLSLQIHYGICSDVVAVSSKHTLRFQQNQKRFQEAKQGVSVVSVT